VDDADDTREPDIVDKALHSFDHVLDLVHDKILRPILLAGRAIAFGLIIVLAALVLVVALVIGLFRLFDVYVFPSHQWLSYAVIGVLFVVAGMVIWRRRRPLTSRK
jgi:ABC-type nickel/cobalt efflux system permease component RcnA